MCVGLSFNLSLSLSNSHTLTTRYSLPGTRARANPVSHLTQLVDFKSFHENKSDLHSVEKAYEKEKNWVNSYFLYPDLFTQVRLAK